LNKRGTGTRYAKKGKRGGHSLGSKLKGIKIRGRPKRRTNSKSQGKTKTQKGNWNTLLRGVQVKKYLGVQLAMESSTKPLELKFGKKKGKSTAEKNIRRFRRGKQRRQGLEKKQEKETEGRRYAKWKGVLAKERRRKWTNNSGIVD